MTGGMGLARPQFKRSLSAFSHSLSSVDRWIRRRGKDFTYKVYPESPDYPPDCLLLPSRLVGLLVDQTYVKDILRTDRANIDYQKTRISSFGFDKPLLLKYDESGKLRLHDGNHRLQAALELGIYYVPVKIKAVSGNIRNGATPNRIIEPLLEAAGKRRSFQV